MKLKYETGIATMIQFVALALLGIPNAGISIISGCHHTAGTDCVTNTLASSVFFLLTAGWFAFIWILGYLAQERRSRLLARLLIAAEVMVTLIALFNLKHRSGILGVITSCIDLCLAIWIIVLAYRLSRSGGTRIVKNRPRNRRRPTPSPRV